MISLVLLFVAADAPADPADLAFFESKIRPLFIEHCLQCHGPAKQKGGLRLDSRSSVLAGGDQGPAVVPGKPKESLLFKAVGYEHNELKMPPKNKLPAAKLADIERWIARGSVWPKETAAEGPSVRRGKFEITDKDREHWAFKPLAALSIPSVRRVDWVANAVDAYVLAKLEAKKLSPNPEADKRTLLRRATFDLTGLPPTPEDTAEFIGDDSPAAFERLVDRLLASPSYGEKWGRHWLDLVRFAETNSYERDEPKPHAWRFRDYTIRSFNTDKSMGRFAQEQLAGDEIFPGDPEALVATGYYRLGLWDDEPADPLQARYDVLDDVVATTGQVFLGLTVDCARCHDHKIDPISQHDYYKLLAFVENVTPYHNGGKSDEAPMFESSAERKKYREELASIERRRESLRKELDGMNAAFIAKLKAAGIPEPPPRNLPQDVDQSGAKFMGVEWVTKWKSLAAEFKRLETALPNANLALVATELGKSPAPSNVHLRGNPHVKGDRVEPGFPQVLGERRPPVAPLPSDVNSSGRRAALAKWITADDNSLAARVFVNRVWQHHFGRGIVRSSNNFGVAGDKPTHPELLDWLAKEWISNGRRLKPLHRAIMLSSAYRMSSAPNEEAASVDPANDLLWRFDRRRLTAEEVRDSLLAASGELSRHMHGPSVYPPIHADVLKGQSVPGKGWKKRSRPEEQRRRTVYVHVKRSLILPIVETFDGPETDRTTPVRFASTQPTQALALFNSEFAHGRAQAFAKRLIGAGGDPEARIDYAYRVLFARDPTSSERERVLKLQQSLGADERGWNDLCLALMNLNEAVYVD